MSHQDLKSHCKQRERANDQQNWSESGYRLPNGFSFEDPNFTKIRHELERSLQVFFQKEGFQELVPPICDYTNTFRTAENKGLHHRGFDFISRNGESLSLRSDITIQILKYAAHLSTKKNQERRFYYIQPVFHDVPYGSVARRDMIQVGAEIISTGATMRIPYLLKLAQEILSPFDIRIIYGDIRIIQSLLANVPLSLRREFFIAFYHKDGVTLERLVRQFPFTKREKDIIVRLPFLIGGKEIIQELKNFFSGYPDIQSYLKNASQFADVIFDFSLLRPLAYYSGPVFEAYLDQSGEAILSGGVYDDFYAITSSAQFGDPKQTKNDEKSSDENKSYPEQQGAAGFAINLSLFIEKSLTPAGQ